MEMKNEHPELTAHIKALGELRKGNEVLADGKYRELLLTNRQYAFARILGDRAVIVAVNNDESPASMSIPMPVSADICTDVFTGETLKAEGGRLNIELDACGSKIVTAS